MCARSSPAYSAGQETAWAENGGIVGRGVLLDYHSWAESQGLSPSALESTPIPLASLQAVAAAQDTTFLTGDILLIRSGYIKAFNALSPAEAALLTATSAPTAIGVESSEANLRWIWEKGFAAVAGDMPSFEAWPCQDTKYFLHEWLLAGWGMPIGELFHLERLAVECAQRRKWTFFFSSMPLKVRICPWLSDALFGDDVLRLLWRFLEVSQVRLMVLLSCS